MRLKLSYLIIQVELIVSVCLLELCIKRTTLAQMSTTLAIPFDHPFSGQANFGYAIQGMSIQSTGFSTKALVFSNSTFSYSYIQLNITTSSGTLGSFDYINIVLLYIYDPSVQVQAIVLAGPSATVAYKKQHKYNSNRSYSLSVYTNSIPHLSSVVSKNSNGFTITVSLSPPSLDISVTYVLVEKIFLANNIFVFFDLINETAQHYYLRIDDYGYLSPSDLNTFQGLTQVKYSSSFLNLRKLINYDSRYRGYLAIKIGFMPSNSTIQTIKAEYMNFNPGYSGCQQQQYFTYNHPFVEVPRSCSQCNSTCLTCTSSQQDSIYTDYRFCTSCSPGRFISFFNNYNFGQCKCNLGTNENLNGQCQGCTFNCLEFHVSFMKSTTKAVFLLVFTKTPLTFDMDLTANLKFYVDGKNAQWQQKQTSPGVYQITTSKTNLQVCQEKCEVSFKFEYPYFVRNGDIYLTKQYENLTISDYYIVEDRLPKQLIQAFTISSLLIAVSSSTGQTSLIKMLFQLQQMIEVHKYLNIELPVVFKEFVEALSAFRFMDITAVISYDINSELKLLSSDQLDSKGSPKIIYYESGVNFYKNMVVGIVSVFLVLLFNIIIFGLLRIIPIQLSRNLAQKIRIRWLITLSDTLQTLIIPISLFSFFQLSYLIPDFKFFWVYLFSFVLNAFIFIFPFFLVSYIASSLILKQKITVAEKQLKIQIYEDLLQDCKIYHRITSIFYVYNFMRKFFFGLILSAVSSGLVQAFLLLMINMIQICIMTYMILNKMFNSKAKMFCRTINLICIITMEGLILGYNMGYNSLEGKILIGVSCTYLTIISTCIGLLQIVIKISQIICQKIHEQKQGQDKCKEGNDLTVRNENKKQIKCNLKNQPAILSFQEEDETSQKSNEKIKQVQYRQPIFNKTKFRKQSSDQILSESSEIVALGISQQSRQEKDAGIYNRTARKSRKKIRQKNYNEYINQQQGSNQRLRSVSTRAENKKMGDQSRQKNTLQTIDTTVSRSGGPPNKLSTKKAKKVADSTAIASRGLVVNLVPRKKKKQMNSQSHSQLNSDIITIQQQP